MEGRSFLRAFEKRKNKFLFRGILMGVSRDMQKMPCKRVSLSTGSLLRNLEGVRLQGLFERKEKVYLGSFLGPGGH